MEKEGRGKGQVLGAEKRKITAIVVEKLEKQKKGERKE